MNKVFLHATYDCNARCIHCAVPYRKEYIHPDLFKRLVNTIEMDYLVIGGGEPLLHPDINSMINYAHQYTKVKIETNGRLLTKEFLQDNKRKIFQINVSIDGIKETHDRIRGITTFDHTVEMIKYARSLNIDLAVWSVVMVYNISEINEIISLTKSIGVNKLSFLYATPVRRCKQDMTPPAEEYGGIVKRVKEEENKDFQIRIAPYILSHNSNTEGLECLINDGDILHVDPQGDIYPCVLLLDNKKYLIGTVEKGYQQIRTQNSSLCLGLIESLGEDLRFKEGTPVCPCKTITREWAFKDLKK